MTTRCATTGGYFRTGVAWKRCSRSLRVITGDRDEIEGTYTIVGQVSRLISGDELVPTIRVIRDVPPTLLEVTTINEAMSNLHRARKGIGGRRGRV
jgi:hypothetical protein